MLIVASISIDQLLDRNRDLSQVADIDETSGAEHRRVKLKGKGREEGERRPGLVRNFESNASSDRKEKTAVMKHSQHLSNRTEWTEKCLAVESPK